MEKEPRQEEGELFERLRMEELSVQLWRKKRLATLTNAKVFFLLMTQTNSKLTSIPTHFLVEKPDACQWTDWSSCDFFCDTPRVVDKRREKAPEGWSRECGEDVNVVVPSSREVEQCDVDHQCTGELFSLKTIL